uniref:paired amphipathic helix protein Sin3a-like n=1 Tax=Myxine glutinosa TaxID=7769 RepID=UPI00358E3ACD
MVDEGRERTALEHMAEVPDRQVIGVHKDDISNEVVIAMDYVAAGSLHHHLVLQKTFSLPKAWWVMKQMASAFAYMHNKNIVHRDIKLDNVLCDDQWFVKVIDFGFAKICTPGEKLDPDHGTRAYLAPEFFNMENYEGPPADVWALGILSTQLFVGWKFDGRDLLQLDVVLETNLSTIRVLENVQKKLSRLTLEEQSHLHLDDCLGGTSEVIHCKALQRIYGDKAAEVIAGLKQNPANSIPVVLKRLKAREEEWREAQKGFNKLWREQNDRFYLRSLDPCGLTFRQLDTKALRSKSLLNQIEEAYDERQELMTTGQVQAFSSPHLSLDYPDHTLHTDATALLLHDLGSHTGPATAELQHTRDLLFVFLPTLLFAPQLNPEDFPEDKSSGSEDESVPKEKENHSLGSPFKKQASSAQGGNAQAETAISPAGTTDEKVDTDPEKEPKGGCGYAAFLALTRRLLDGEMEPSEYEDALRDLLTIHGFVAYTMDRLVHHACRQLQQLVCDEACMSLVKLHREARARGAGGGLCVSHAVRAPLEACYHRQAEQIVADDNCFKVMFIQSGEHVVMTMELLDSEEESTEDTFEIENWSNYVEHYTNSEDVGVEIHLSQKPIFLRRNLQRQQTMENMIAQWYRSKQRKSELNIVEDLEYRFRFNSFQLQFMANSEDYFYRRGSLHRARQHRFGAKRLQAWHCWLAERARKGGLLKEQDRATRMWFMGLNQESSTIMVVCLQIMANGRSVNLYRSAMCTSSLPDSP